MRIKPLAILLAIGTVVTALTPQVRAERTPPGAFLRYRVKNSNDAARQVIENKVVADRYASLYKVSPGKVADAFASLDLSQLKSDWHGRVYFLGRKNRVISEMRTLKKGAWVYTDWRGNPVLDAGCGNPLGLQLPPPPPRQKRVDPISSNLFLLNPEPTGVVFPEPAAVPILTSEYVAPPEVKVSPIAPVLLASHSRLNPLPLLIPFLFTGGGHDNPPPPVPEPASMMMAGMGLAAAFRMRRCRR